VDGSPTEEADTEPGCLDRLTLAGCTDEVEGLDRRPSIYESLLLRQLPCSEKATLKNGRCRRGSGVWLHGKTIGPSFQQHCRR